MAKEHFQPGHPFIFWTFVLGFIFASLSGSRAALTINNCAGKGDGSKHWQVMPPEWVCGKGGIQLTRHS
jgi:hypothetical protein